MARVVTGNRIPLYQQVAKLLRQGVRTGVYFPNAPLPTVRKLSEQYDVSIKVIQQAIAHLRQDGTIITHHGKGMMVADSSPCKRTSFLFGLIQPFSSGVTFEQQVVLYAEEAFNNRDNLMVVRSSKNNGEMERLIAEHLINNGVQGILLWPADHNPNAEYFQKLSTRLPVVVLDRKFPEHMLSSVTLDMYKTGKDICTYFLKKLQKNRLLVLMNNLQISPDIEFLNGIHEQARKISRMADVTVTQLPISDFICELNKADYSSVNTYCEVVYQLVVEGKFDAIFCPQEEFLEAVLIESGIADKLPNLKLGSMTGPLLTRGRKYNEFGVVRWVWDFPKMIEMAADLLQEWVLTNKCPKKSISIECPMLDNGNCVKILNENRDMYTPSHCLDNGEGVLHVNDR